jgi:hypothetical protein
VNREWADSGPAVDRDRAKIEPKLPVWQFRTDQNLPKREPEKAMKLIPTQAPGRSTRKVRAFGDEIRALRDQGHTFQSIRSALSIAGVQVSKSTVQREARRCSAQQISPAASSSHSDIRMTVPTVIQTEIVSSAGPVRVPASNEEKREPVLPVIQPQASQRRSGKEIAEAFVNSRFSHPLIRERTTP